MKYLTCLILIMGSLNSAFAQDTLFFAYNKKNYIEVASNHLQELYNKEKTSRTPLFSSKKISDRYLLRDLEVVSIPVFYMKDRVYTCGDNLEISLSLVNDPSFQVVIVSAKSQGKVASFEIFDSYYEIQRIQDSINIEVASLHGRPIYYDSEKIENKLESYMEKNSNALVFMIKGFHGYWAIRHGKVFKLSGGICRINEIEGSQYVCENYGQEYINDIIRDEFRTGRAYARCLSCEKGKNHSVLIKLE